MWRHQGGRESFPVDDVGMGGVVARKRLPSPSVPRRLSALRLASDELNTHQSARHGGYYDLAPGSQAIGKRTVIVVPRFRPAL